MALDLLRVFPIIDAVFLMFWMYSVQRAWANYTPPTEKDDVGERGLGASVILAQLSGVITGASIVIAGVGAFVALSSSGVPYPANYHSLYAALWSVAALGLALYTSSVLPTRAMRENFVRSPGVAYLCAASLFFILAGGVRFLFAVWTITFPDANAGTLLPSA